jgi:hypothetical protein
MKKINLFLLLLIFGFGCIYGQKQNNIWIFGNNVQIDFNSGQPILQYNSALRSYEGSSSICDLDGNLLFFTNGGKLLTGTGMNHGGVWNRNNQLMPNGNLDSTSGCNSSAQGCLIVPSPSGAGLFYVFTLDCAENSFAGGLRYSIVDMILDGGLGDVTTKNVFLEDTLAESICGIRHSNGRDYWLIVHGIDNDKFYSYLINPLGIQTPIISSVGEYVYSNAGQMQATVAGDLIVYATTFRTMLYDFDNSTGIVSNYRNLNKYSWGCSFSAGCRYLYTLSNDPPDTKLYQFDTQAPNVGASAIEISAVSILYKPLQLAPDGKIYFPNGDYTSTSLCVINNPDSLGLACNYVASAFSLDTLSTVASMPVFIAGLYGNCNFVTASLSDIQIVNIDIAVFPNPACDLINVKLPKSFQGSKTELYLCDVAGSVFKKESFIADGNVYSMSLPAGLCGIFYLHVSSNAQSFGFVPVRIDE